MTRLSIIKEHHPLAEIVHHFSDHLFISSYHRRITIQRHGGKKITIKLPLILNDLFGFSRLFRRALRLDKCNVFPIDERGETLIIIRQGKVYKYCDTKGLRQTLKLRQSRNVLHCDFCITKSGRLLFGEYGANARLQPIPIYSSDDHGENWRVVYEVPAGKAKHIHGVYADRYSDKIWILTGDRNGESWIIKADEDFKDLDYLGDGSQTYRACTIFFTPKKVVWAMDSPLKPSQTVHLDRETNKISMHGFFPGPIWYGLELYKSGYLLASSVEPGDSVTGNEACIYYSNDLISWSKIKTFKKDILPIELFKFGVIGFSRGLRSDTSFYIFGEALKDLDGKSCRCLVEI